MVSRAYLSITFLVAALSGSVFSLLLLPNAVSVGASGGLLGIVGFLLVVGYRRRLYLPPGFLRAMATNVALVALMGVVAYAVIDNAAHLGGFLAGLMVGLIGPKREPLGLPIPQSSSLQLAGTCSLVVALGFGAFAVWRIAIY